MKKVVKWSGGIVLGFVAVGMIFGGESEDTTTVSNESVEVSQQESEPVTAEVNTEPKKEEPKEKEPKFSLAQQNAIGAAEQYINTMPFSKEGLVEQLKFDGFKQGNAEFAVNNIKVNWKEQAVQSGKQYLDTMSFSRSGLIEQLKFDGYTKTEATYAVDQIGL